MQIHIYIIGTLLMVLALVHIIFPKYFNWKIELQTLALINRQMMTTHTFFIALTVFLMGLLCVTSATELIETTLGNKVVLGLAIFWTFRLFFQFFVYSKKLWKGKKFETIIHIIFSVFWVYLSTVFFTIYFNN
ncbi:MULTISPECIES: hypothetical protein [Cellulophaga]|uniref:Uncharacterized protein n=2 Tax=Cellulophaga TaxID=104264 RepID=F0RED6_CELLC|nr:MULTISPECIES: hypothetical protein [Cellulophaga]ADY29911.1 hypothetical protein Celly_2090 [Cellulophaga lytica DSM 7489]APU10780.1 hypothetical protein A5M85_10960 [Cellulophaga lytica]EWH15040.1 hypothetical protein KLA_00735 [Cellulophaga geojensis KL-A]MDO6853397.1 hypothetical protein [Cellulophaga lytica]TVZ07539.1 hypothetical protein JM80_0007 [Cellulophaga sp. RHA_52]